jgi:hypothetical protein
MNADAIISIDATVATFLPADVSIEPPCLCVVGSAATCSASRAVDLRVFADPGLVHIQPFGQHIDRLFA